jgi:hypothetical protein
MEQAGIESLVATGDGATQLTVETLETRPADEYILFERQDDWCATAYFYFDRPSSELPPIEEYSRRVAGLAIED